MGDAIGVTVRSVFTEQQQNEQRIEDLKQKKGLVEIKLESYTQQLESLNNKLDPIEKALPVHLKTYIANNSNQIDEKKLSAVASSRYQRYLTAITARAELTKRIQILHKVIRTNTAEQNLLTNQVTSEPIEVPETTKSDDERRKPRKIRKAITKDVMLQELRFRERVPQNHIVQRLPSEMWFETFKFLKIKELIRLSAVDKTFYILSGNEQRWKSLCIRHELGIPNESLNQTCKTVYAYFNLGPKKCSKCGTKTTRHMPCWNMSICLPCQPSIALNRTQAKKIYMLNDEDLSRIQPIENSKALLYLKSDVEQCIVEKYKGTDGIETEMMKRKKKEHAPK